MHILLTDVLTCPRCGPEFGLVLLADSVEERRVLEGWLGCANCRERYRVERGFAELRFGAAELRFGAAETGGSGADIDAMKIAALLGITEGPALILLIGAGALHAATIAELVPGSEVVAAHAPLSEQAEQAGVSRIGSAQALPIRSASMRGVALTGEVTAAALGEAARVAAPRARLVVTSGSEDTARRLVQLGLRILARDTQMTVAERPLI